MRERNNARESGAKPGAGSRVRPSVRKQGAAYQGALEAIFAILIAVAAGYLVDQRFGTSPRFLFVGVALGFGAFVLRLWRLGRALQPPDGEDPQAPPGPPGP